MKRYGVDPYLFLSFGIGMDDFIGNGNSKGIYQFLLIDAYINSVHQNVKYYTLFKRNTSY
jgi:hypothetical protein